MKAAHMFGGLALATALAACGDDDAPPDYMKVAGGGLTFNYRYSQATMVVVGRQLQPLPEGGSVVALFDVPGETARQRISVPVLPGKLTYKLESKYLTGITKGQKLTATLLVLDATGKELDRDDMVRTSDQDQSTLPSKPLVDPSKPNYVPQLQNL